MTLHQGIVMSYQSSHRAASSEGKSSNSLAPTHFNVKPWIVQVYVWEGTFGVCKIPFAENVSKCVSSEPFRLGLLQDSMYSKLYLHSFQTKHCNVGGSKHFEINLLKSCAQQGARWFSFQCNLLGHYSNRVCYVKCKLQMMILVKG